MKKCDWWPVPVWLLLIAFAGWVFWTHSQQVPVTLTVSGKSSGFVPAGKVYVMHYYVTDAGGERFVVGTGSLADWQGSQRVWGELQTGRRYQAQVSGQRSWFTSRCIRSITPEAP